MKKTYDKPSVEFIASEGLNLLTSAVTIVDVASFLGSSNETIWN